LHVRSNGVYTPNILQWSGGYYTLADPGNPLH